MTVKVDTLSRANASFRRGGIVNATVLAVVSLAFLAYWLSRGFRGFALENLTQRSVGAWVVFLAFLALFLWMIIQAWRSSRSVVSSNGIERGDGTTVQWTEVAAAEFGRGWLRLTTHDGRRVVVSLAFASSSHSIVEAVQDHLPSAVRLQVF